jgi:CheY-like chemotaxis protein
LFARLLTEECSARLGPLCEQKQIKIKNLVSNDARLFADSILLDQCVENVLSNSIKFCKEGGEITIFTPEGQPNTIGVKDDGVGIKQEMLCDLFKHEVKTTTVGTNGEMGTGLGLPHCYDIMLAHNGSITVESAPGQGSTFYLNFPALRMTILAIDDQPDDLFLLKENLSPLGADIVTANNGKTALELLKTITPHIIISDLYMPEMDGMEFIAALRQNPAFKHTPVIAITTSNDRMGSESEMEVKARLFKLGANDFISKTQLTTELLPRVSRHLSM